MENLDQTVINVAETLMKNYLSHFFLWDTLYIQKLAKQYYQWLCLYTRSDIQSTYSLFFNGPEKCVAWWLSG